MAGGHVAAVQFCLARSFSSRDSSLISIMNTVIILLLTGGVILTIGDIIMKKWVLSGSSFLYVVGLSVYLVGLIFLAQSYKFENIAVASAMLVIFNVVTLSLVSWLFFKEPLSVLQMAGIALGLAAVFVLALDGTG